MPRFFTDEIDLSNLRITGGDARHIGRSLRMKLGDDITLCCDGTDYFCKIQSITDEEVLLDLERSERCIAEPSTDVILYQAIPKLDKLEQIIQKTVELGVTKIVPVLSRRCVSRPNEKDFQKKLIRLNKISEEAAKQSGRGIIPEIMPMITFKKAVEESAKLDKTIILYEESIGKNFSEVDLANKNTIGVFIGSEGGFDREEVELALSQGAEPVWLGKRILRCETAPITALSILMFLTKNM